jgi:hypothetical protein
MGIELFVVAFILERLRSTREWLAGRCARCDAKAEKGNTMGNKKLK